MTLSVGDTAPDFELEDQNGQMHRLSSYRGRKILLYFYPRDFTAGCTAEACQIRDKFPEFATAEAVVLGVSTDSSERHKKFATKHELPFTLLADVDKDVVNKYGVWQPKKFLGKEFLGTVRTSFLIDEKGKISKIYEKVKPTVHADEVLSDLSRGGG